MKRLFSQRMRKGAPFFAGSPKYQRRVFMARSSDGVGTTKQSPKPGEMEEFSLRPHDSSWGRDQHPCLPGKIFGQQKGHSYCALSVFGFGGWDFFSLNYS